MVDSVTSEKQSDVETPNTRPHLGSTGWLRRMNAYRCGIVEYTPSYGQGMTHANTSMTFGPTPGSFSTFDHESPISIPKQNSTPNKFRDASYPRKILSLYDYTLVQHERGRHSFKWWSLLDVEQGDNAELMDAARISSVTPTPSKIVGRIGYKELLPWLRCVWRRRRDSFPTLCADSAHNAP